MRVVQVITCRQSLTLAAVRHQRSSPLISAQEQAQSDVNGQENPSFASGDRLHFPGSTRNPEVTRTKKVRLRRLFLDAQKNMRIHRLLRDATSPIIPLPRHRETSCSQKKIDDMTNLLSRGVKLIPNVVTTVEENFKKTFGTLNLINFPANHAPWCGHHSKRADQSIFESELVRITSSRTRRTY